MHERRPRLREISLRKFTYGFDYHLDRARHGSIIKVTARDDSSIFIIGGRDLAATLRPYGTKKPAVQRRRRRRPIGGRNGRRF